VFGAINITAEFFESFRQDYGGRPPQSFLYL
jgi:hypothetical protein